jgi:hypothetical protein
MKTQMHNGWRIYKTSGGSNNRMGLLNAKHPLKGTRLSTTIPDNGDTRQALAWIKRDIDAMEKVNPTT